MAEIALPEHGFVLGLATLVGAAEGPAADALDDDALVRAIVKTGDEDLFAALIRRHKGTVFRIVSSTFGPAHEAEAEELTQEVFILVFLKLATFRHECAFSTWLYRLTRNLAIDQRRHLRWRLPHLDGEVLQTVRDDAADADPEERAAARERRCRLVAGLDQLSEMQRIVLLLHYWFDCPVAEIGRMLDVNLQTVKSHLHRGRQRLAAGLGGDLGDG